MKPKIKQAIIISSSLILVIVSLFLARQVNSEEEMKMIPFGQPFGFIFQDCSQFDPYRYFPWYYWFTYRGECPLVKFSIIRFLGSFLSILIILEILVLFLESIKRKIIGYFEKRTTGNPE